MQFKIGDKVSFLNEKGGGIISGILSKSIVKVSVEDGFDIPVSVSEIVLSNQKNINTEPLIQESTEEEIPVQKNINYSVTGESGVFLVLVPLEPGLDPQTFRVYIANNTVYKTLYSYTIRMNGRDEGRSSGLLEPVSFAFLQHANKSDVEKWDSVLFRLIFHKDGVSNGASITEHRFMLRSQMLVMARIKKMPLMQQECFSFHISAPRMENTYNFENKPANSQSQVRVKDEDIPAGAKHLRFDTYTQHVEIDLHIEELIDSIAGLNNSEIIKIQLQKFQLALDHAIEKKMKKLFVIHGVGNGTLKREIRKLIDSYDDVSYTDAPSRHYGAGATEVTMK